MPYPGGGVVYVAVPVSGGGGDAATGSNSSEHIIQQQMLVRFRHPDKKPLRSATVNGAEARIADAERGDQHANQGCRGGKGLAVNRQHGHDQAVAGHDTAGQQQQQRGAKVDKAWRLNRLWRDAVRQRRGR